ncbi:UAA transporter [Schizophyllum commune Loenen D]|nr:UAA transporter [Schizophyllum commune Loenen D]
MSRVVVRQAMLLPLVTSHALTRVEHHPYVHHGLGADARSCLRRLLQHPWTIFCSNAITLERLTSNYPKAGSLITFAQFLLISLFGLRQHIVWTDHGPRLRPRRVKLAIYCAQVVLHFLISMLNNAAFAYRIPMAVHIIFRSAGLVITMVLGYVIAGKRYNLTQVISVLVVTVGVALTTLSAAPSRSVSTSSAEADTWTYLTGIAILLAALVFSGCLGLIQDYAFSNLPKAAAAKKGALEPLPAWQESIFYLHVLGLPLFTLTWDDLVAQTTALNAGPRMIVRIPLSPYISPFFLPTPSETYKVQSDVLTVQTRLPEPFLDLALNTLTQLVCSAGVHRLTSRVSSLTVTLILVIRKAASLVLSVAGFGTARGRVDQRMMWTGAVLVLLGTIGYACGSAGAPRTEKEKRKDIKKE